MLTTLVLLCSFFLIAWTDCPLSLNIDTWLNQTKDFMTPDDICKPVIEKYAIQKWSDLVSDEKNEVLFCLLKQMNISSNTSCALFIKEYATVPWHDINITIRSEFNDCIRQMTIMARIRKFLPGIPDDLLTDPVKKWEMIMKVKSLIFLYAQFLLDTHLKMDSLHSIHYGALCRLCGLNTAHHELITSEEERELFMKDIKFSDYLEWNKFDVPSWLIYDKIHLDQTECTRHHMIVTFKLLFMELEPIFIPIYENFIYGFISAFE